MIKLSIIMSVYNEKINDINESIQSILNQTFKKFEFIIIDDNPISNSIRKFLINKSNQDNRIKLLFNKTNIGLISSINKGVSYSNGNVIARMDADDIASNDRFYKQLSFMRKNDLDFVCANFSTITSNGELLGKSLYSNKTQIDQNKIKHVMSYCSIANGPSFCFRKEVFNSNNGYRNLCIDDYDFAVRSLINNYRLGYQKDNLIYKRIRKNSISTQNCLLQYIYVSATAEYLRKTNFRKIVPLEYLYYKLNNVSDKSFEQFKIFVKYRSLYKKYKNIKYIFKLLRIICSSKIIFKRLLWMHLINSRQEKFM